MGLATKDEAQKRNEAVSPFMSRLSLNCQLPPICQRGPVANGRNVWGVVWQGGASLLRPRPDLPAAIKSSWILPSRT